MGENPVLFRAEKSEFLHGNLRAFMSTSEYIGITAAVYRVADRDAHSEDEERFGKNVRVGAEFDQQVESMTIEIIVDFEFI
jgi:hypothetical protein